MRVETQVFLVNRATEASIKDYERMEWNTTVEDSERVSEITDKYLKILLDHGEQVELDCLSTPQIKLKDFPSNAYLFLKGRVGKNCENGTKFDLYLNVGETVNSIYNFEIKKETAKIFRKSLGVDRSGMQVLEDIEVFLTRGLNEVKRST